MAQVIKKPFSKDFKFLEILIKLVPMAIFKVLGSSLVKTLISPAIYVSRLVQN